jgi:hypothetical protein
MGVVHHGWLLVIAIIGTITTSLMSMTCVMVLAGPLPPTPPRSPTSSLIMSRERKDMLRNKVRDMFYHGYNKYVVLYSSSSILITFTIPCDSCSC